MSTTLEELETELAQVRAAKLACLTGGQSYSIAGRSYTRPDYEKLCAWETKLEQKIERMTSGGGISTVDDFSGGGGTSDEDWD